MRTAAAFVLGGVVASALLLARPSPAAPSGKWEYKVLDVLVARSATYHNANIDGESEADRAKRLATPDPLALPLIEAERDGWELICVVPDNNELASYIYFFRRAKP